MKDTFDLPRIFTRKVKKDIYIHYIDSFNADEDRPTLKPLGKTLFMEILNKVVSGDSRMLTAVDYVTGYLVHDTCNILLRIIRDLLSHTGRVAQYIQWLEVTRNFLKVQYIGHARKSDDCCTHGLEHGLCKPVNYAKEYKSDIETNSDPSFEVSDDETERR
jgi:hypothetical protein